MRLLLLVLACLFSIHTTTAQDIDRLTDDCKCKSQIESSEMGYTVEKVEDAINILCGTISSSLSGREYFRNWDRMLKEHFEWQGSQDEILRKTYQFLNDYSNCLICEETYWRDRGITFPAKHLYKRMFAANCMDLFEDHLLEAGFGVIDFNAYEIVDGKKETLLDWIDKKIAIGKGPIADLKDLKEVLEEEFYGKRGKDLPKDCSD